MTGGSPICPACGTPIAAGSGFCSRCGARLQSGVPANPRAGMPTAARIALIALAVGVLCLAVIALMAALVMPRLLRSGEAARSTHAHASIMAFEAALATYKLDTGEFPTTQQGLRALREKPEGAKDWAGPYLAQDVPTDPWGHEYAYRYPGEHGDEPDIICYGADGQPGGEGSNADIFSWEKP
jgi:general secretion pathway protein G